MNIREEDIAYDLFDPSPEFIADPYPTYHRLRRESPVHWSKSVNAWVLTRYGDCLAALRDTRLSSKRGEPGSALLESGNNNVSVMLKAISSNMVVMDPPDHTRLRNLVNRAFTPRVVEMMRNHIREIADNLLDKVASTGQMDIIGDFAYPFPAIVICEMLGVPAERRDEFRQWSDDIMAFFGGGRGTGDNEAVVNRATKALEGFQKLLDFFRKIVADRRRSSKEDLISALLRVEEQGDVLNESELLSTCMLLLPAGHETTTNLIGNGMAALLKNPEEIQRLRENPDLYVSAVEELLRFDTPVQFLGRMTSEPVKIGSKQIESGRRVMLMLAAANRDPEQFQEPDKLDIARQGNRHIAFGFGVHFCLGAALARTEGQIALDRIFNRLPDLRLENAELDWYSNVGLRSLRSLHVSFRKTLSINNQNILKSVSAC